MTLPPRFPPPARPDLADRLLAAVAERDQAMADRLVQQWVHRRGLVALDGLISGQLLASQGADAVQWLQARADGGPFCHVSPALPPEAHLEPELIQASVDQAFQHVALGSLQKAWHQSAAEKLQEAMDPAPTPRALAPLRAWLPDSDQPPLAS